MDFQSAMETFAEAWVAANTKSDAAEVQNQALSLTRGCKSPTRGSSPSVREPERPDRPPSRPHSAARPPPVADSTDSLLTPKKEIFDLSKTASAKSLPVHCIVEGVTALETLCGNGNVTPGLRRPSVEADSYVIIPASTAFRELVAAALLRLGYPHDCAAAARGSVIIKNWKPLTFDRISDGPLATVGEILGELTTVATLRIQVLRPRTSPLQEIKDKLLRLLLVQSHGLLLSSGCPLDEVTLAQICRGSNLPPGPHNYHELNEDVKRKFEQWWNAQVTPRPTQYSPRQQPSPITKMERPPSLGTIPDHVHPALQTVQTQYPTQKTRMRTSFDPELELPKLQRWFADNQHPSRQQIQNYVRELNNLESRRGRKPLDVNNVVYWFKNARAAQKRAELRNIGPGGLSCHLSLNGYNSSSHSPPNGAVLMPHDVYMPNDRLMDQHSLKSPLSISPGRGPSMSMISEDNLSNGGSDAEDDDMMDSHRDDERPETPDAPLSLITTKKEVEPDNKRRDSPKPPDIPKIDEIKQEPLSDDASKPQDLSPTHFPNNNNNNHVENNNDKSVHENNISEDEEDEDIDHETVDDDGKSVRRLSEESLQTMHPSRVADMNRERMRSFRSPSPNELMPGGQLVPRCPPGANLDRFTAAGFPLVPNSMFSHSIMYMSQYIPSLSHGGHNLSSSPPGSSGLNLSALAASAADERRKRNRTFIDPVTEVPRLEQWFSLNTHPSHNLILKYTEELNRMPYRQKFPRLESKNVQFWFKNRRAKCKRLKMSLYEPGPGSGPQYHVTDRD